MIIGFTGYARSGKDSAAAVLVEEFGFTKVAFADGVREMLKAINPRIRTGLPHKHYAEADGTVSYVDLIHAIGYEKAKEFPDVRSYLQRIGTEAVRNVFGEASWVNLVDRRMFNIWWERELVAAGGDPNNVQARSDDKEMNFVIPDVRYANEADYIHQRGGYVIRLRRPFPESTDTHSSEQPDLVPEDYTIDAPSLDSLQRQVRLMHAAVECDYTDKRNAERALYALGGNQAVPASPRIYVAATAENLDNAIAAKARLIEAGYNVVSTWTEREVSRDAATAEDRARRQADAVVDRAEVGQASVLLIIDGEQRSSGKATELGMALGTYNTGRRIIVVNANPSGNIFYTLPEVEHATSLDEAILLLDQQPPDQFQKCEAYAATPAPSGGFQRTLDPAGRPLPGTPWHDLPVEDVQGVPEESKQDEGN